MSRNDASQFFKVGPFDVHAVYLDGRVHAVQVSIPHVLVPGSPGAAFQRAVQWADVSDAHLVAISEAVHAPVRSTRA